MAFLVVASLTACSIEGIPIGGRDAEPTTCAALDIPAPPPGHIVPRPGLNQAQMTISVEVRAGGYSLDKNGQFTKLDREWCVPFDYTISGTVTPFDGPVTFTTASGVTKTLPASGAGFTPFAADAILTWDVRDEPPLINVGIMASYATERDFADYRDPNNASRVAFRCAIFINGGPHPIVQDMREDARALGEIGFVRCDLGPNGPIRAIPG